jgi:hypothetical protein
MNRTECPKCGHKLKFADEHVGRRARCQKCEHAFLLPDLGGPAPTRDCAGDRGDRTHRSVEAANFATQTCLATPPAEIKGENQRPFPVGDKRQCPRCGSADVRAMAAAELNEFYGRNAFVLTAPRRCRSCGHGWEVRPTKFGCYVMIAFSALLGVCSIGAALGAAAYCVLALLAGKVVTPLLGGVTVVLPAVGFLYAAIRSGKKYRGFLKQAP